MTIDQIANTLNQPAHTVIDAIVRRTNAGLTIGEAIASLLRERA